MLKRLLTKWPLIVNQHASVYWDDLYFIKHLNKKTQFTEELEKAIEKGGLTSLRLLKKYNIHTSRSKISDLSIEFILLSKLYKKTTIFKRKIV